MKQNQSRLLQQYTLALRKHLRLGTSESLQSAIAVGNQAASLGLAILALGRIHKQALAVLRPTAKNDALVRAEAFFIKAANPILCAANTGPVPLIRSKKSGTNGRRQKANLPHPPVTSIPEKISKEEALCLRESRELGECLQQLAHRALADQEEARTKISHELQDEIAQILLGINARLIALKQQGQNNPKGLKKEIASMRRLVVDSRDVVLRFAHELGNLRSCGTIGNWENARETSI